LSCALRKIGADVVVAGRQAIDGDTAQVGPQVAGWLGLPQVAYAEQVEQIKESSLVVRRRLERGVERVESPLPMLLTVNSSADEVRPQNAMRLMKYKYAVTPSESAAEPEALRTKLASEREYLNIVEWTADDIDCDKSILGLAGSPTKVKSVEAVVFQDKQVQSLTSSDEDIEKLMVELIASRTLG
jgi:electron transfer flavoprotein beta subunit